METDADDLNGLAVVLLVLSSEPSIADRTQIQKKVFIVNECSWNAIKDYTFIGRGPFSKWLDAQLDDLRDKGMVDEKEESILIGTDNEVGFYCYSLTNEGKSFTKKVFDSVNKPTLVNNTMKLLSALAKYTEEELEIVSAILYVSRDKKLDSECIVRATHNFRRQFTEEQIRRYIELFNSAIEKTT